MSDKRWIYSTRLHCIILEGRRSLERDELQQLWLLLTGSWYWHTLIGTAELTHNNRTAQSLSFFGIKVDIYWWSETEEQERLLTDWYPLLSPSNPHYFLAGDLDIWDLLNIITTKTCQLNTEGRTVWNLNQDYLHWLGCLPIKSLVVELLIPIKPFHYYWT